MKLRTSSFPFGNSDFFLQFTNGKPLFSHTHSHDFYEINIVIKGSCDQIVNGAKINCKKHSLLLLRPCDTHKLISQLPNTNLISISIKSKHFEEMASLYGTFFSDLIHKSSSPPFIEFDLSADSYIQDSYTSLAIPDANIKEMYYNSILGKMFQSIAAQHNSLDSATTHSAQSKATLYNALEQMNNQNNIAEGVPALQRLSGYSKPQLCRLMKKYTGHTPQEFVKRQRINLAYNMITHTCLSISEIAEKVGFASDSHFISVFKKEFGITPAQKRKEMPLQNH